MIDVHFPDLQLEFPTAPVSDESDDPGDQERLGRATVPVTRIGGGLQRGFWRRGRGAEWRGGVRSEVVGDLVDEGHGAESVLFCPVLPCF